jgi:YVTN family beta-propeller protein
MVYVADANENTVSVIDGSSDRVVGTVAVGNSPDGLAISPQTHAVYVVNIDDNTVSELG